MDRQEEWLLIPALPGTILVSQPPAGLILASAFDGRAASISAPQARTLNFWSRRFLYASRAWTAAELVTDGADDGWWYPSRARVQEL
jgi:hypothetical protein